MDDTLRQAWNRIYYGNCHSHKETIIDYIVKYASYIYKGTPWHVEPLKAEDLQEITQTYQPSSSGLDN
eukprot:11763891-Karenia_brevis.AAC.1